MKKAKIITGQWEVYHYRRPNGKVAVISFSLDLAKAAPPEGLDHCFRIGLHLLPENLQPGGLPTEGMIVQLEDIERDLVKSLETAGVTCRMVGRLTFEGNRIMAFQAADESHFAQVAGIWISDFNDFQADLSHEHGWSFFEETIKPSAVEWQSVVDRKMIEKLLKAGSHPGKMHQLEHSLSGDPASLEVMAEELGHGGFKVLHFEADQLVVQRPSTLDVDEVSAVSSALFRFAKDIGVNYEGWGARVVQ